MPLPLSWVDRIFDKLMLVYGRDFIGRWEGLPIASVKTDWGHELGGFEDHPDAIKHALQNLPPAKSPTVLEFRKLCLSAPVAAKIAIAAPPADPVFVAQIAKKIKESYRTSPVDHKAWAKRLQARDEAGEPINMNQRRCYRIALNLEAA